VGQKNSLDKERRKSCPNRDSNSDPSAGQTLASRYTDRAIPDAVHQGRRKLTLFFVDNYKHGDVANLTSRY
jgi:hypothetical protein